MKRGVLIGKEEQLTPQDLGIEIIDANSSAERNKNGISFPSIPPGGIDFNSIQKSLEEYYIKEAIRIADGNETKAAMLLKINHHTFRYHWKKTQKQIIF